MQKSRSFSGTSGRSQETTNTFQSEESERGRRSFEISRQQSTLSTLTEQTENSHAPLTEGSNQERNHTRNFLESMSQKIPDFFKRVPELLNKVNCYGQDKGSESLEESQEVNNQQERQERLQDGNHAISEAQTIYTQGVTLGRDQVTRVAYRQQNPIDAYQRDQALLYRSYLMDTALSIGEWTRRYEQTGNPSDKETLDGFQRFFQERVLSEFHRRTGEKHPMEDILTQSNIQSDIDISSIRPVTL